MDTYKFKLPENKEVQEYSVKVKDGELIVDIEMTDKFEPKDGDFLCVERASDNKAVFIYKRNSTDNDKMACYVGLNGINRNTYFSINSKYYVNKNLCRYATEEEKSAFLARLKKEHHKKWNPEKKCLEDIYVPKFGDIIRIEHPDCCLYKRDYVIAIMPNKDIPYKKIDGFCDIAYITMEGELGFEGAAYDPKHIYPASEDEKKDLFDKLAEAGKRWNPETKKLEDIRWKPEPGEHFWYITPTGDVAITKYIQGYYQDEDLILINNCFKTSEIASKEANRFKEFLKNSKAE